MGHGEVSYCLSTLYHKSHVINRDYAVQTPKSQINAVDDRPYYQEMQDWLSLMISYETRTIRMIQDAYVVMAMDAVLGTPYFCISAHLYSNLSMNV